MKAAFACILLCVFATTIFASGPPDLPCVTWEQVQWTTPTPDPSTLFIASKTWVMGYGTDDCTLQGDIIPCWSADSEAQTWGHHDFQSYAITHDYCRSWVNGQVYFSQDLYIPKKGPKWETWKWQLVETGQTIPDNAIRFGDKIMARNQNPPPGYCFGKGYTGWAEAVADNKFGKVHFSIVNNPITMTSFEVAICKAYHPTPVPSTPAPPTPVPATPTPATPSPTASPTLPPSNKPYVRFGNTIPSDHNVDAVVSQTNASYTWTNIAFAEFSHWVEVFADGDGTIDIYENVKGVRGKLLLSKAIYLTPGPLVIVTRDQWPPHNPWNVETIAASYIPSTDKMSGVRLFNLSPDTPSAGLKADGVVLVDGVKYSIGSSWAPVKPDSTTFIAFDDAANKTLATDTFIPPPSPFVFTNFLIGMQNATNKVYKTRFVPLIDAPEQ